jgi:hypothetical protein
MKFRSKEEEMFYDWLMELDEAGLVYDVEYEECKFEICPKQTYKKAVQLKTKINMVEKHLLNPLVYTPDFTFSFDRLIEENAPEIAKVFEKSIDMNAVNRIIIDVKGSGSMFHDAKYFSAIQKVVYDDLGWYVQKIVPEKLFAKTFAPTVWRHKKNGEINALGKRTITLAEMMEQS